MKRSKLKGPFVKKKFSNKLRILPRDYEITSNLIGIVCNVYSGKQFIKLTVTEEMVGYKLGEFVATREKFVFKKKKKK